jgi:polyphosphate kinase
MVPMLIRAAEQGKQAVVLVELKARFDEERNIGWARALERAGVHVVYGFVGLKTHAKCALVVRREGGGIRRYVHIGTGNYHPRTARLYTDFGLLTCRPDLAADVADLFNYLTGFARPRRYRKLLAAPLDLRERILAEVERVVAAHTAEQPGRIVMKMNSLVDRQSIEALYAASQAGVRVDLIVRGICCLRPGVPGLSEGIRVVSLLGRFLEHERVYQFTDVDGTRTYMGSADLMPRNLDARVEVVTPVEDAHAAHEVDVVLQACLHDDRACWQLQRDGTWSRIHAPEGEPEHSAQSELMTRALAASERAEEAATLADESLERVVRRRGRRPGTETV